MVRRRRIAYGLLAAFMVVAMIIGFDYVCYRRYRVGLPPAPGPFALDYFRVIPDVEPELMSKVGYVQPDKSSHFVNFEPVKAPDVIRIGCFGDSFTYGDEVDDLFDYPSLLQQIFRARQHLRIEVLNFGSCGYGFHQAYLLWEALSKKFGIDYVLLGPGGFYPERDTSFTGPVGSFANHARYILKNNELELVEALGNTPRERVEISRRFWPSYRYLRYESKSPLFLAALLPKDRDLPKNPFYYTRKKSETEAIETYRALLSRMAESSVQVVVLVRRQEFADSFSSLPYENLTTVFLENSDRCLTTFPYAAPGGHYGPLGYRLIAEAMYGILTNRAERQLPIIVPQDYIGDGETSVLPLNRYEKIGFNLNGASIGWLCRRSQSPEQMIFTRFDSTRFFSLFAIKAANQAFTRCLFVPITVSCVAKSKFGVTIATASHNSSFILGEVTTPYQGPLFGIVDVDNMISRRELSREFELILDVSGGANALCGAVRSKEPLTNAFFTLDEQVILTCKTKPSVKLAGSGIFETELKISPVFDETSKLNDYLWLSTDRKGFVEVSELPDEGMITLELKESMGKELSAPFARWHKSPGITLRGGKPCVRPIVSEE